MSRGITHVTVHVTVMVIVEPGTLPGQIARTVCAMAMHISLTAQSARMQYHHRPSSVCVSLVRGHTIVHVMVT